MDRSSRSVESIDRAAAQAIAAYEIVTNDEKGNQTNSIDQTKRTLRRLGDARRVDRRQY